MPISEAEGERLDQRLRRVRQVAVERIQVLLGIARVTAEELVATVARGALRRRSLASFAQKYVGTTRVAKG